MPSSMQPPQGMLQCHPELPVISLSLGQSDFFPEAFLPVPRNRR